MKIVKKIALALVALGIVSLAACSSTPDPVMPMGGGGGYIAPSK